ncbi:hypothetical protein DPEC_G00065560 [Dallia pectoralis]|uniref:Uncharacterized protein n=1 Tax=Dallia pectoralis TaxID=75939 RepID=A0ACC2H8D9_DALPE|nr:hypothetical protein DPEC_G00065560 [Dallia pectoralis]
MENCFCALWMTVVLASITRRSGAVGPVIRCEPCDVGARLLCKPLPKDCAERAREPGCGCCMTCALAYGQPCGVYTGRCGDGMTCQQQPGETRPLQALLEGRGQCANATRKRTVATSPAVNELQENVGGAQEEEQHHLTQTPQAPSSTGKSPVDPPRLLHQLSLFHTGKAEVLLRMEHLKRTQIYKVEELPRTLSTDQHNFSLESKSEPEYSSGRATSAERGMSLAWKALISDWTGLREEARWLFYRASECTLPIRPVGVSKQLGPCRIEMESILNGLKISDSLNPRGFRIPNCDKMGFYKKKQCRPSKGRKRGFCWCTDMYGQHLPGFDGKKRGDAQCYSSESQ